MKDKGKIKDKDGLVMVKQCQMCERECKIYSLPSAVLYCPKFKKKEVKEDETIYNQGVE